MCSRLLLSLFFFISSIIMATEQPSYKLLEKDGSFELRNYQTLVVIQTTSFTSRNSNFKQLASYIFGKNETDQKIAMTAPVLMENYKQPSESMMFVLPQHITYEKAPAPLNENVIVLKKKIDQIASVTFSGFLTKKKVNDQCRLLRDWATQQKILLHPTTIIIASYNPPWTLPHKRKNECWIPVLPVQFKK